MIMSIVKVPCKHERVEIIKVKRHLENIQLTHCWRKSELTLSVTTTTFPRISFFVNSKRTESEMPFEDTVSAEKIYRYSEQKWRPA